MSLETSISYNANLGAPVSVARLPSAVAGTDATLVRSGKARVLTLHCSNTALTPRYIKLYDKGTAPVPGTDTPRVTLAVLSGQSLQVQFTMAGIDFQNGLGYAITNGSADSDTTATAAGDIVGLNLYYV